MPPPTTKEFDVQWYNQLRGLRKHIQEHNGKWPTSASNKKLFRWVKNQRHRHRHHVQQGKDKSDHWKWRITDCTRMGVNLFYVRQPNQVLPSSTALWDSKIYCWKQKTDHRLTWFWSLAEMYSQGSIRSPESEREFL